MNRAVDFQFPIKIETGETLRAMGYVTGAGEFRLSHAWDDTPSGCLTYGVEYRKGVYSARAAWGGVYDDCPTWLIQYLNSDDFRKVVAAELRRIAKRFEKAARQQDDGGERGGEG